VVTAVEDIDVVLAVNPDRVDFLGRPTFGQLRPILDDAVFEIASANDDCHTGSPPMCRRPGYLSDRRETSLRPPKLALPAGIAILPQGAPPPRPPQDHRSP